jgi:protein-disulfide isomerase
MYKGISASGVATGILVLCAIALTGNTVVRGYKISHRAPSEPWTTVDQWQHFGAGGHATGAEKPSVTVVVFSDYQCPVCLRIDRQLKMLGKKHPSDLRVVWRHFPLAIHPFARGAAIAAECAGKQNGFVPFHEALFDHAGALGTLSFTKLAGSAGLTDTVLFSRCVRDSSVVNVVDRDIAAGNELGVFGTPTVLVNDEEYVGIPWDFNTIVERHLSAVKGN